MCIRDRFKTANHDEARMCAASPHRGLSECKGCIQLDTISVPEPRGSDADDGVLAVAECDDAADDVLRTAEAAPPETVGQDGGRNCAFAIVFRVEVAPHR